MSKSASLLCRQRNEVDGSSWETRTTRTSRTCWTSRFGTWHGRACPGRRGAIGQTGPSGLVGDVGDIGPPGRDGRCNCSFPDLYVHHTTIPGPPIIQVRISLKTRSAQVKEKLVPVPVVVVKEVEVTRLVPFEPTPPGFGPPPGWSPGMPKPDLSKTQIIPRCVPSLFGLLVDTRQFQLLCPRRDGAFTQQPHLISTRLSSMACGGRRSRSFR